MKKISKLIALAAGLVSLFAIGCSGIDDESDTVSADVNRSGVPTDYNVQFLAADGTNLTFDQVGARGGDSSSERTIVASGLTLTSLNFYVWGTNLVSGTSVNPVKVDFTADTSDSSNTKGTVRLDFTASNYKFVLAATETVAAASATSSAIQGDAVLIGYAQADLRNNDTIKFYISADGLTGQGGVALTLQPDADWSSDHLTLVHDSSKYEISAGMYSRSTGTAVSGGESQVVTNSDFDSSSGFVFNASGIQPGTYNFVVSFKDLASAKIYEYSDTIIILPNQTVTQDVLVPDVVEYAPVPPSNFFATYIEPETTDSQLYGVMLQWKDESNNEKYFEVEIADVSDVADTALPASLYVVDDTMWGTATSGLSTNLIYKYGNGFYGNREQNWVAGSFSRNNNHVVLNLKLGRRYLMRLAAVNDAGTSDYVYVNVDESKVSGTSLTWSDTDPVHTGSFTTVAFKNQKETTAPSIDSTTKVATAGEYDDDFPKVVNLYRLTYHLNNGTLTTSASDSTTKDVVNYLSQGQNEILVPCNDPNAATPVYPSLVQVAQNKRWTDWRVGSISGSYYLDTLSTTQDAIVAPPSATPPDTHPYKYPEAYTGYKNLDLFASYSISSAGIEYYNDSYYNFQAGEIVITGTGATLSGASTYTVPSTTASVQLKYTFNSTTPANRPSFNYDSLTASIVRSGNSSVIANGSLSSSNVYTINITGLGNPGTYLITITGEYKGHTYTKTLTLIVQDP